MNINQHAVKAVCHLLGLDPNTTIRIDIDANRQTVSLSTLTPYRHDVVFSHEEHHVASGISRNPGWEITDDGYIEARSRISFIQQREKLREESPIFCAAADKHNLTVDRENSLKWKKNPW